MPKRKGTTKAVRAEPQSYFGRHYGAVRLPIATFKLPGLRRGQLGAIHAIGSHFALRQDPAVISMPTGSGKTAVLVLAAYLLRSKRVLAITPSRLVRDQIADEFSTLKQLRAIQALEGRIQPPRVENVSHRVTTPAAWQKLRKYDVVVGTPNCVSPALSDVAMPPADFFDLVLMDEAHHSPAKTWSEILDAFPNARKLLVSATPFRRDRKEIRGTLIFDYPVRQAYEDGVFGKIELRSVKSGSPRENDENIAKMAETVFRDDRSAGLDHFLMVRTDSRVRADELAKIYGKVTSLVLRRIDSSYSLRYMRQTIKALKNKELDGVIAVDMMGEGFDFPNLKIAALHIPQKSLAATLQFIGRFVRTGGPEIGQAKIIAVPQEVQAPIRELYNEGAEWQEIIPALSDTKVQKEITTRAVLRQFRPDTDLPSDDETRDLSLYAIRPYSHVKIYRVSSNLDIRPPVRLEGGLKMVHRQVSETGETVVFVTRLITKPKWAPPGRFNKVEYDLFVLHLERQAGLLFICTSRRNERLYRHLVDELAGDDHDILAVDVVNRVLRGIENADAFSVGIRSRMQGTSESYRIMVGPSAAKAIRPTDARMYHRGHAMFRGRQDEADVSIGFSSASKVWQNAYFQIPELIEWCKRVAAKLQTSGKVRTGSNWDTLPMGERSRRFPTK